jgi:ubiquinone/menaquinone biosynthesis C-methylase UbiE
VSSSLAVGQLPSAFDRAAERYDLMVALNPGYHRHLRMAARAMAEHLPAPARVVDLGCGSGASTAALVQALPDAGQVVGIDASAGMLDQARRKSWPATVEFRCGRAEDLTASRGEWGLAEPVDGVFAAYLFRNVSARDQVLASVRDQLRPGGRLVVQDYSVAGSRRAATLWTAVCRLVVIPLSWLTMGDTTLYRYLWRSVLANDSVQQFVDRLWAAGFVDVEVCTVGGWQRGILHTFRARTPA